MTSATSKTSAFNTIIVDDTDIARKIAKRNLETIFKNKNLEFSIDEAEDGVRGWDLCKDNKYHLYVIDYMMPRMNGIALCRKILKKIPDASIVLYSSREVNEIEKEEGLIHGRHINDVLDYVLKDTTSKLNDYFQKFFDRLKDLEQFEKKTKHREKKA